MCSLCAGLESRVSAPTPNSNPHQPIPPPVSLATAVVSCSLWLLCRVQVAQGNLAHKKPPPPRTLQ